MSTLPGLPWSGGGPWAIAAECTSAVHNSLAAGRGKIYVVNGVNKREKKRCVCPRSLILIARDNELRRKRSQAKAAAKPAKRAARPTVNVAAGTWVPDGTHVPDLSAGLCRTPEGLRYFDLVISGNGNAHRRGVIQAKALCSRCPVREVCEKYVREGEADKPGIWRGVWAGRTAAERRAVAKNV